jgi:GNAT superfamily N-acetyltransferase
MGLTPVKPGELAAVVTSLEMRTRPRPGMVPDSPLRLVRWKQPTADAYRTLFKRVGAPWLWFSRLVLDDTALLAIIHDEAIAIWAAVDRQGVEIGLLELDFREGGQCEIGFFGFVLELAGKGNGRWLMAHTLNLAWRPGVERVWVHTCTLDHPSALSFYIRSGFLAYARAVEQFADPRLLGILPEDAAPQVPLIRGQSSTIEKD